MNVKILFARGEGCYIVEKDSTYYLVNIETDTKPSISEFAESFFKFGYFTEVHSVDEKTLRKMESKISTQ